MTEYSNPKIPEGVNVSSEHPLKDFFIMLSGISIALVLTIMLLLIFAQQMVRSIPFEVEQALTRNLGQWQSGLPDTGSRDEEADAATPGDAETALPQLKSDKQAYNTRVETYLQKLSNHLLEHSTDPLPVTLHYIDSDIVNALS